MNLLHLYMIAFISLNLKLKNRQDEYYRITRIRRKILLGENTDETVLSGGDKFRIETILKSIDTLSVNINKRANVYNDINDTSGMLNSISQIT